MTHGHFANDGVVSSFTLDPRDLSLSKAPVASLEGGDAQKNAAAVARLGSPRRLAYGPTEIEKVDVYTARQPNAPINVFIHGGAWRAGTSAGSAYLSEAFVDSGAHFVAVHFNNVIETNGNLMTMADQVRRAVA